MKEVSESISIDFLKLPRVFGSLPLVSDMFTDAVNCAWNLVDVALRVN